MARLTQRDWRALAALTLLAAALRAYQLNAPLWYDEILTLLDYVRLPFGQIVSTYESLNNHILFSLQSHVSVALFGEDPWALRLPAMLFGVATVPLIWLMVRGVGLPRTYADVSALLVALNYHHIWFSQNARGYTGLVFWCLLAMFCLILARRGAGRSAWIGLALSGALAMYTHLSAAFFLFALCLAAIVAEVGNGSSPRGPRIRDVLLAFVGMAVVVLLLYAPILDDIYATMTEVAGPVPETKVNVLEKWENPLLSLLSALEDLPGPLAAALIALPVALIILVAGWVRVLRADAVLAWSVPLSIGVTVGLLILAGMRIWPRYFLVDVVLFLVLTTAGVAAVTKIFFRDRVARALCWTGWGLGIALSAVWGFQNFAAPKQDFAGAIAFAEVQAGADDRFGTFGLSAMPIARYYRPDWAVYEDAAGLEADMAAGRTWIVIGFEDHSQANHPEIFARLEAGFDRVEKRKGTLGGGTVMVYRSRAGEGDASQ